MPRTPCTGILAAVAGLFLSAPMTAGDVPFEESFESLGPPAGDGPSGLVDAGWQFSVQATAGGGEVWHEGPECGACWPNWPAYDGDHYLMIGDGIVAGPGDAASAWAVLPDVPGIAPGDVLTFRLRGFPNFTDVLQVRFAPNGGTGTGTGAFDVGDFTDLLFEEDLRVPCEFPFGCAMDDEWYIVQVPIPRAGRLAVRYFIPQQASGGSGSHVAIDALAIGPALSEPPYPAPGETVHWTLDGSPYVVPDHRTVPAGATVIIDAGVTIDIEDEKSILVEGVVEAQGTAAQPIVVNAPSPLAHIDVSGGGIVMFDHVDIGCRLQVEPGNIFGSPRGTFIATNAHFRDHADIGGAQLGHARALLVLDQCTFDGTRVRHSLCQADVRHATFTDSGQIGLSLHGYVYLEDVSMTNGQIELGARRGPQPMYVNDITVTGYADGGGLLLTNGQNFLLGPDNVLQNNRYPVELGFDVAGLLPGSVVPASGNTNNYVFDSADYDPGGNITWAALDVPYVVDAWRFMNALRVMPGATVQFKSGAGFGVETRSDLIALGTPEAPITFEGFGGGAWDGLTYLFIGSGVRLDHCTIRDAEDAVALIETLIKTDNCLFRDNGVALKSGYDAIVRSSRLVDNTVGIESPFDADGTTNPNVFDGNGIAVIGDASDTARSNWWGAPNGPQAPGNPGDGDAIVGPVPYAPFLTEPPVATNHPPTVRLMESPLPLYVPGRKMIFHWAADDDDAIVSQRVLFSDFGHYPNEFTVVADDLHPAQRSFEFVIPDVGLDVANAQQAIRIEAVDAHGQVGWDEQTMYITVAGLEGDLEFTSDFDQVFQPGDSLDLTWSITGLDGELSGLDGSILFDADSEFVPLGVQTFIAMPDVSTDSARITIAAYGGLNRLKYFFSPEFSIRPDPLVGDEPPTVTLTSGGGAYAGGDIVPLSWTASDDEGIHSFVLMASYDGGETWHDLTEDLAPDARSHDWQLPTSTGIDEVRVRVVVRDRRFQNSSDDASFALLPGTYVPGSIADLNGDGAVDAADLALLLAAWDTAGADLNGDGTTNAADLAALLVEWTG